MFTNLRISLMIIPAVSLLGWSLAAPAASAETVVRSGEAVSIAEEQLIEGDFYAAAGKINVSGSVSEDMVAAAGQITINGSVGDNVFLMAGQVDVHGTIGDDLRIIAGETIIAEPVMGDVLVLGGVVTILSTASISGDVVIYAGEAIIEGSVGGSVMGTAGVLRIDTHVAGDVDVTVDRLTLGERANVEGSVRYVSKDLIVRAPDAIVAGELLRSDPLLPGSQPNVKATLIPLLLILFSTLVWYMVSRRSLSAVVDRALVKSPRPLFYGFITLLLTPLIFMLLMASLIGSLVGLAVLFGYLLLITLSCIALVAVLGQFLMNIFNRPAKEITLLALVVGVLAVGLLMLLPVIGQIILLLLLLISFGAMVDLLRRPTIKE